MIFTQENAGKWVASKNSKVILVEDSLETLVKKVEKRPDRKSIWFDKVPSNLNFIGMHGI